MFEALFIIAASLFGYLALAWIYPPLLRPVLWLLAHTLYRFRVLNSENIPKVGGALIVCNHVSYVDWLALWVASPRSVRFVLWNGYYRNPLPRFLLSWARRNTIRIDDRVNRPHAVVAGLKQVAAALDAGEIVVIFPEGQVTRSGNMFPFGRGIEHILKHTATAVPVIPACTGGLWGGFFSHGHGPALRKFPSALRPRVAVWFGLALNKGMKATDYRLAVQEATADLAIRQSDDIPLVHRAFLRNATSLRNLFRPCAIDNSTGTPRTLTWGKTLVAALCVQRALRTRVGDSTNIGIWLPTSLGGALANLAVAFMGKTSVNLNYTAGTGPVRSAVRQAGVRVVITSKRFQFRAPLDLPEDVQHIYLEDVMAALSKWQQIRTFLAVLLLPSWVLDRWLGLHRHKPDDTLTIVFSSGSTGEPKGVMLTHRNVGHNVHSTIDTIGIERTDRLFAVLPFFHSFGYTVCMWAPLVARCSAIFYPDPRSAKEVGDLVRRHRATLMLGTATFLRFYLRRCDKDDFRTLRILVCGAEKLPVKLQEEFFAKFGLLPLEGYGCTELSPVVSVNLPDVAADEVVQQRNTRGTVGQPILGVCVRAFSLDEARTPLPVGEEGVLCVKGPNVMAGYLDQPHKTAEAIRDGWYNTGDVGHIEPDGFIRITGRVSRFAKIAGEMVPLERLDEELHDVLGTNGDRVLAVAAVADEKRGERLVVLYLPAASEKLTDALDALAKRGLPNLWVPDRRDCYPIDAMPVLGSGKLDLKKLGDLARELVTK